MVISGVSADIKGLGVLHKNIPHTLNSTPTCLKNWHLAGEAYEFAPFAPYSVPAMCIIEKETKFIGPGYIFPILKWPISLFYFSQQAPFRILLWYQMLFWWYLSAKAHPLQRPYCCALLCNAPSLISVVICLVVLLLLQTMCATHLPPLSFTSL